MRAATTAAAATYHPATTVARAQRRPRGVQQVCSNRGAGEAGCVRQGLEGRERGCLPGAVNSSAVKQGSIQRQSDEIDDQRGGAGIVVPPVPGPCPVVVAILRAGSNSDSHRWHAAFITQGVSPSGLIAGLLWQEERRQSGRAQEMSDHHQQDDDAPMEEAHAANGGDMVRGACLQTRAGHLCASQNANWQTEFIAIDVAEPLPLPRRRRQRWRRGGTTQPEQGAPQEQEQKQEQKQEPATP